ncbi:MAG: glycosyltransferase family 2 protein [Candidatus Bathyarchaeia archaeon]
MLPMVSVFWVNYNSMHVIDIIKESLNALMSLDYPYYELVIVDNGSTDGSREVVKEHVKKLQKNMNASRVCIIKLDRNSGFAGGANIAYRNRDLASKYVTIVNNDAIPCNDYLKKLVPFMESHEDVGAVQGIVLKRGSDQKVDSAGLFVDEFINTYAPFIDKSASMFSIPFHVSYIEGTMPLYRVDAIVRSLKNNDTIYVTAGFMYFLEDVFLSLMLWNSGYRCVVLPVIVGEHYRKATLNKFARHVGLSYYSFRNRIALLEMTNNKRKRMVFLSLITRLALSRRSYRMRKELLRAMVDGICLGKYLKEKYGVIDLEKVPLIRTSIRRYITLRF